MPHAKERLNAAYRKLITAHGALEACRAESQPTEDAQALAIEKACQDYFEACIALTHARREYPPSQRFVRVRLNGKVVCVRALGEIEVYDEASVVDLHAI